MPGPVNLSATCHPGGSCYVYHDAAWRQTLMAGRLSVRPQGFVRAPITPAPWSGFLTENTPFDKGHIIALELGGPDVTENIVPQYQQWQETGEWKAMENLVKAAASNPAAAGLLMVIRIDYGRIDLPNHAASSALFNAGQRLTAWEDRRIPTRFRVWTLGPTTAPGNWLAPLLAANTPPDEAALLARLTIPTDYDLTMQVMPQVDRLQQRKLMIADAAKKAYNDYSNAHEASMSTFYNQPLAGFKKRTRGSLSEAAAAGAVPIPAPKLKRTDWLNANWATVPATVITTDMTLVEQNVNQYDVVSSVLGMFGV